MTAITKVTDALKRMVAGRTALIFDEPFFGGLGLQLKLVEDTGCRTAWTDGVHLGYNPTFIAKLTFKKLVGLIVHEVMHCAYGHPWRQGAREHKRWNKACDYAINSMLRAAGFELPDGALFPEQIGLPDGKSAEWYYDRIPATPKKDKQQKQQQSQGKGEQQKPDSGDGDEQDGEEAGAGSEGEEQEQESGNGDGAGEDEGDEDGDGAGDGDEDDDDGWDEVRRAPTQTEDGEPAPTEADWQEKVQNAAALAEAQGKLPGSMKRFAEKLTKSRIDWVSSTKRFAQEVAKADFSWRKPNPRYLPGNMYLPGLNSYRIGSFAIGVDTSGSIDQTMLNLFGGVMQEVIDELKPRQVVVMMADAAVHTVEIFEEGEPLVLRPVGGGGTDFRPVFKKLDELDEPPAFVIYLTDLMGAFPETDPGIPTLWVTAREPSAHYVPPFGEVLVAA